MLPGPARPLNQQHAILALPSVAKLVRDALCHVFVAALGGDADAWARLATGGERVVVGDIMAERRPAAPMIDGLGTRARAYVQVQTGCDHRCTFCIIPYGRGNSRSVPAATVVEQVARLVDRGFNEVVLTGVDLTSWGADLEGAPRLGDLVAAILARVPDLPRLRDSVKRLSNALRGLPNSGVSVMERTNQLGMEGSAPLLLPPPRTFPAVFPWFRLDRIYQRGFAVRSARVLRGREWAKLSDHSPLLAELELP